MDNFYKGKTLVISGGTRGIGRAILLKFAKAGANIAFTYNSNEELAQTQVKELEKEYNIKARCYALNILEPETYKELFLKIDEDFDRVDFFISNAIISGRAVAGGYTKFMKLKPRGINNIFTATVNAFVVGAQEAAKRMEKVGGGSIISISSTGNRVFIENYSGHGTCKAAVEAMVRYAATELGEKNIRVNAVSGGPIDTDALKAFTNYEEVRDITAKLSPLGRMGQPEDLAGACLFLCSKDASWVTGHTLIIDGGTTFK
ncbi:7-alpha-hydroxysteroid dehydrogenase [Campylobacter sputorum subsp. bubulus]|uniref:7-alpha-hydroxysteroid dehydrogenase n=1 Tax=Campylobacter sputorum subsp. sputorum TaxID=32024 RepID=A0A381DHW5_9BACT|nr:enoyl-ACP reductase [Campylobacter sputorum]ASM35337.1 short-chain dehydrogenase/reductase [Campylobacter sputorum aubsp. sputorum RM3237]ASM37035.1 short-chain dehydrogenase/reductase [Campylobacter sputorum bv. faecalis CCUG 20703]KAB0582919.1 enoyl-ACP reductase [Campylobacter sputorum subsp. sputorum]MDY6120647.1 enoyl-ACP reductase [Campylobacter sputorum]QEL05529.1 short-chain dehydrogenase/reductase [Campylobacter sputorum subsp. sputorum]